MFPDLYSISNYIFIEALNKVYLNVLLRDQIDLLKHIFTSRIAPILDNKQIIFSCSLLISIIHSIIIRINIIIVVCIKFVIVIDLYNLLDSCLNNRRNRRDCEGRYYLLCRSSCCLPGDCSIITTTML